MRQERITPKDPLPVKSFNYMTEIVLVGSFKNMTKRASAFQFW